MNALLEYTFIPHPDLIETDLEQELLLLNPNDQQIFSLNETGMLIWRAIQNNTLSHVPSQLVEYYEVSLEEAQHDVLFLVIQLQDKGLIHRA
jgi:Coenzyme PQQ synthesis protein D (PqqD)